MEFSVPKIEAALVRIAGSSATDSDYVTVAETFATSHEFDPHGHHLELPGDDLVERCLTLLLQTVAAEPSPDPMAVWALGRSGDHRGLPILADVHERAFQTRTSSWVSERLGVSRGSPRMVPSRSYSRLPRQILNLSCVTS